MLKIQAPTDTDKIKNYFSTTISNQLFRCILSYRKKKPVLSKYYKGMTLASIETLGLFARNMNLHGKFAKMAKGHVEDIEKSRNVSGTLSDFYAYFIQHGILEEM